MASLSDSSHIILYSHHHLLVLWLALCTDNYLALKLEVWMALGAIGTKMFMVSEERRYIWHFRFLDFYF